LRQPETAPDSGQRPEGKADHTIRIATSLIELAPDRATAAGIASMPSASAVAPAPARKAQRACYRFRVPVVTLIWVKGYPTG
jgi:hypothetical protein